MMEALLSAAIVLLALTQGPDRIVNQSNLAPPGAAPVQQQPAAPAPRPVSPQPAPVDTPPVQAAPETEAPKVSPPVEVPVEPPVTNEAPRRGKRVAAFWFID